MRFIATITITNSELFGGEMMNVIFQLAPKTGGRIIENNLPFYSDITNKEMLAISKTYLGQLADAIKDRGFYV